MAAKNKKTNKKSGKNNSVNELMGVVVEMSKRNVELIGEMHALTQRVDKLVTIFEEATTYLKSGKDSEALRFKLERLIEQNKELANNIVILEKMVRDQVSK